MNFQMKQSALVAAYEAAVRRDQLEQSAQHQKRWDAMRDEMETQRRTILQESRRRREERIKKQEARTIVVQQFLYEVEYLGQDERRARSIMEGTERGDRRMLRSRAAATRCDIAINCALRDTANEEVYLRIEMEFEEHDMVEALWRRFLLRSEQLDKQAYFNKEKWSRIAVERIVKEKKAFIKRQENQWTAFHSEERRGRSGVADEEGFKWLDMLDAKRVVLEYHYASIQKVIDRKKRELEECMSLLTQERKAMDLAEVDARQTIRTVELMDRSGIRGLMSMHLEDCRERILARKKLQAQQWLDVCAAQQRPLFELELAHRAKLQKEEMSSYMSLLALARQSMDDLMIPLRCLLPERPTYALTGPPLAILSGFTIEKKSVGNLYSEKCILKAFLTAYIGETDGYQPGDEIDLVTTEVFSLKEKVLKPVFSNLRSMEGAIFDEKDGQLGTLLRVVDNELERTVNGRKMTQFQVATQDDKNALSKLMVLLRAITFTTSSPIMMPRTVTLHFKVDFESLNPTEEDPEAHGSLNVVRLTSLSRKASVMKVKANFTKFDSFEVRQRVVIQVKAPILQVPKSLQVVAYELKKKAVEGTTRNILALFSHVQLSTSEGLHTSFQGGTLKIRFLEGYQPADSITFEATIDLCIRKSEILFRGCVMGHVTNGKFCTGPGLQSSKEIVVTFDVPAPSEYPLNENFIRSFLSVVGFVTGRSSDRNQRVIEVDLMESNKIRPKCMNPTTCKVTVCMVGAEEFQIAPNTGHLISFVRTSQTPSKPSCPLLPALTVRQVSKNTQFSMGYIHARIVENTSDKDALCLQCSSGSLKSGGLDGTLIQYQGKKLGTLKYDSIFKDLCIDLVQGNIDGLQEILRSISFRTTGVVDYPIVKTVQIEIFIPDPTALPPKKGSLASLSESQIPRRILQGVCVCPPSVVRDVTTGNIQLMHSSVATLIGAFTSPVCEADETLTFFDGGMILIELVEGGTQFDLLSIMPSGSGGPKGLTTEVAEEGQTKIIIDGIPVAKFPFPIRGTPLRIQLLGKQSIRPLTLATDLTDTTAPREISRSFVRQIVQRIAYSNLDKANSAHKMLHCVVTDAQGATSEAFSDVEILVPNAIMRILLDKNVYRYRYGDPDMRSGHVLAAFKDAVMSSENLETTELIKNGSFFFEPISGCTIEDHMIIFSSAGLINTQGSAIYVQETKIGTWRTEYALDDCEGLRIDLTPGISINHCRVLLHHIGFVHSTPHPRVTGVREFLVRFKKGDGTDDTRLKVGFDVQPPILWVLPMYEVVQYVEGSGNVSIQPFVYIGLSYGTALAGSELEVNIVDGYCLEDELTIVLPRSMKIEASGQIVVDLKAARDFLGHVVTPTPGFTGVLVGTLEKSEASLKIIFDRSTIATTEFLPVLVQSICYFNSSVEPRTHKRKISISMYVRSLKERSQSMTEIEVVSVDNMTEVTIPNEDVSMVQGFPIHFATDAIVEDPDTRTFEAPHSYISAEIVNCPHACRDQIKFVNTDLITVDDHTGLMQYRGTIVGQIDPARSCGRLVSCALRDAPIDSISDIMASLQFSVHDSLAIKVIRMLEVHVCSSNKTPPTRVRVQVSVHPRILTGISIQPPDTVTPDPKTCLAKILPPIATLTPLCLSGGEISVRLLDFCEVPVSVAEFPRNPTQEDYLVMENSDNFSVDRAGNVSLRSTGTRLCAIIQTPHKITISCHRGSKFATGAAIMAMLQTISIHAQDPTQAKMIPPAQSPQWEASPPASPLNRKKSIRDLRKKSTFRTIPGQRLQRVTALMRKGHPTFSTTVDTVMLNRVAILGRVTFENNSPSSPTSKRGASQGGPLVVAITCVISVSGEVISSTDYVCIK